MADFYDALILSGSLHQYMEDEMLPAVSMNGLTWDEVSLLCGLACRQDYTCVVSRAGGEDDGKTESGAKL